MGANDRQVAGDHYKKGGGELLVQCPHCQKPHNVVLQHWDLVKAFNWDYFQGQITKYVMRWKDKNGVEDLKKAGHFLEKYVEVGPINSVPTVTGPVDSAGSAGRGYIAQ